MPKYTVTIRRDAWIEYQSSEFNADSPAHAAMLACEAWKRGDNKIAFERDSSSLHEYDHIDDIDPESDVEEIEEE